MSQTPATTAPAARRKAATSNQPPPPSQQQPPARKPSTSFPIGDSHRTSSPQVHWMQDQPQLQPTNTPQTGQGGTFSSPILSNNVRSTSARTPSHPPEVTLGNMGGYRGDGGHYMSHGPSAPGPNFSSVIGGPYGDDRASSPRGHYGAPPGSAMFRSPHTSLQPGSYADTSSNGYLQSQYQPTPQQPQHLPPPGHPQQERRMSSISMLYDPAQAGPSSHPAPQRSGAQRLSNMPMVRSPEKEEEDEEDEDEEAGDDYGGVRGGRSGGRGGRKGGMDGEEDDEGALVAVSGAGSERKRRPHATRRRVVQSCSECRRRKIKCDKKFPCGPCLLRDDRAQCHEVGMAEKNVTSSPFALATAADLALVAQRLDALESALTKSGALVPADLDQYLRRAQRADSIAYHADNGPLLIEDGGGGLGERRLVKAEEMAVMEGGAERAKSPARRPGVSEPGRSLVQPKQPDVSTGDMASHPRGAATSADDDGEADVDPQDDTEGAALTLEHLAFGRSTAEGAHAIPSFAAKAPSAISKHAPNNDYHLVRPHPVPLQGATPPTGQGSGGRAVSGSANTGSVGNSPAEMRRKSSLMRPPSQNSTPSHHGTFEGPGSSKRKDALSGTGSYGETLTEEDRAMRIDALLDLIGPMDIFTLFYRKSDVGLRALTKVLPEREIGELLVKTYLEKVDWQNRCLHTPTFLRQCNDLWALPKEMIVHDIALPFVALYYSVCCLGVQFMDSDEARKHFTNEEIRDLPDLYFNAARSCMWAGDFIGRHTIENLQCILLLGVFMNNRDRGEAAWALLGAAIKMAQGLGLSRLGAEPTSTDAVKSSPMWTGRWESVIEREVGRRIWWNLVFLDWALSPTYNFSCSIHPDQIKTALPSNIEDEDIVEGQILRPHPPEVRTRMSFVLARIKFIQIMYRQICEANIHRHPPYSFILSVDGELRKAMMELPLFFQPNSSDKGSGRKGGNEGDEPNSTPPPIDHNPKSLIQYYEKVMLNLAIHSRMLRLHRPWLSRGYTDERFAYSKEQCIRAARASLRLMGDTHGTATFLEKWWLPLFYVSVSGLVVIIDLLRTNKKDMHSRDTEQKISEVRGALDQMRQIADISHPSRSAVKVMEFLLAEVEERRRPPRSSSAVTGNKRKSPDDDEADGLQRAVKKLIRQAQLETDSPTTSNNTFPETTPPSASAHSHASVSPHHDPARDRPVFDAYPLLPSAATLQQRAEDSAGSAQNTGVPRKGSTNAGFSLLDFNFDTPPSQSSTLPPPRVPPRSNSTSIQNNNLQLPNAASSSQGYRPYANQPSTSPFPFQMDFDPSGNPFIGAFPTFNPDPSAPGPPQLDPSVEDLLANYFPTPQQQQNASSGNNADMTAQGWGTVPDDFLSRVFSFSWDTTPGGGVAAGTGTGGQNGQSEQGSNTGQIQGLANASIPGLGPRGQGGTQQGQGSKQTQHQSQGQEQGGQAQHGGSGAGGQGSGGAQGSGQGSDFVPFDWGTSSGGWMA